MHIATDMEYRLIVSTRANEESKVAIDHYDAINPDLGFRFIEELQDVYQKLTTTPQYYSFIASTRSTSIRDVKLPSFPYVVVFEIIGDITNVISVRSSHQEPLL